MSKYWHLNSIQIVSLFIKCTLLAVVFLLISWSQGACGQSGKVSSKLPVACRRIAPLFEELPEPQAGDWLAENQEPGQTYAQYVKQSPVTVTKQRDILYIQTLGKMSPAESEIIEKAREYLAIYYGLEVKMLKPLPSSCVPESARRLNPHSGQLQLNAMYIIQRVMMKRLPSDAAAYIVFTPVDLWPGGEWNFCFGYATYQQRVGVWSIARNGELETAAGRVEFLRRTLRIAAHETGHMFSILHCTKYRCCMNGVNSLEEADVTPLAMCPECLAKVRLACKVNLERRWEALLKFYQTNGLEPEADFVRECMERAD